MHWGHVPEPNGRAIPVIVAAVLFVAALPGPLFSQSTPPAGETEPPPGDTLRWRDSLTADPARTDRRRSSRPSATAPKSPNTSTDPPGPPSTGTDLGGKLLRMLLVLAGVCALAYAVLRWGVGRLVGATDESDGPIEVLARRRIDADAAILIVRVGSRTLVVGKSDAGLTRLDTLDDEEIE